MNRTKEDGNLKEEEEEEGNVKYCYFVMKWYFEEN
jgi:hypothetical protein